MYNFLQAQNPGVVHDYNSDEIYLESDRVKYYCGDEKNERKVGNIKLCKHVMSINLCNY